MHYRRFGALSICRTRHLAVTRSEYPTQKILRAVDKQAVTDCRGAKLVGVYEGVNIQSDKRSITVRIEYRSEERTLKDEEVEERHAQLTSSLLRSFSAEQR